MHTTRARPQLPVLLFWGKWGTLVPKEVPLTIVYGKPIAVARVEKPTEQQARGGSRRLSALPSSAAFRRLVLVVHHTRRRWLRF